MATAPESYGNGFAQSLTKPVPNAAVERMHQFYLPAVRSLAWDYPARETAARLIEPPLGHLCGLRFTKFQSMIEKFERRCDQVEVFQFWFITLQW